MGATEISESTKKTFLMKVIENDFGDLLQFEDLPNNNKVFFPKIFQMLNWPER